MFLSNFSFGVSGGKTHVDSLLLILLHQQKKECLFSFDSVQCSCGLGWLWFYLSEIKQYISLFRHFPFAWIHFLWFLFRAPYNSFEIANIRMYIEDRIWHFDLLWLDLERNWCNNEKSRFDVPFPVSKNSIANFLVFWELKNRLVLFYWSDWLCCEAYFFRNCKSCQEHKKFSILYWTFCIALEFCICFEYWLCF